MKFKNNAPHDLIVGGRLVKSGETFDSDVLIENPNFEAVEDAPAQAPAPQVAPQPAPAPVATPVPTPAPAPASPTEGATS